MDLADSGHSQLGRVDAIFGVESLAKRLREGICRNPLGLSAQATTFGWIISGDSVPVENPSYSGTVGLVTTKEGFEQVKQLWEIEDSAKLSEEERACEALYESTVVRGEYRYQVSLLLRPRMELGESRAMARNRLYCLENRFEKNPQL